jgi:hypothetical protein
LSWLVWDFSLANKASSGWGLNKRRSSLLLWLLWLLLRLLLSLLEHWIGLVHRLFNSGLTFLNKFGHFLFKLLLSVHSRINQVLQFAGDLVNNIVRDQTGRKNHGDFRLVDRAGRIQGSRDALQNGKDDLVRGWDLSRFGKLDGTEEAFLGDRDGFARNTNLPDTVSNLFGCFGRSFDFSSGFAFIVELSKVIVLFD